MASPPVHRTSGDRRVEHALAAAAIAARVYASAERQLTSLTESLASRVVTGGMPVTIARRRLRRTGSVIIAATEVKASRELEDAGRLLTADAAGYAVAASESQVQALAAALDLPVDWKALLGRLEGAGYTALNSASEALTRAVEAADDMDSGEQGLTSSLRSMLAAIGRNGLTGYTDIAGRNWRLGTYARAAVMAAATKMHLGVQFGVIAADGADLVIVNGPSAGACRLCAPWVGRVLSVTGETPQGTPTPEGPVMGTVSDALSDGVGHPACRHDFDPL